MNSKAGKILRTGKLAVTIGLAIGISAALTGCAKGYLGPLDQYTVQTVFHEETPGSAVAVKLYGSEKNTQLCALRYENGEVYAASFPVSGMPLYAFADTGMTLYVNPNDNGKNSSLDVNALRTALKTCLAVAKKTDYYHQPQVQPDA